MWSQVNTNTVHLLYLAVGGFLCLFMLFSAFIKDKLYFGEANIALLVGAILGPFAAKAVNPNIWSNFEVVVLEFSRIVIIIQCFAVGLELPRFYISKHWKSLLWLVGPVVIWGWIVCSLLVWFMVPRLSFKQSMTIASCFNAIDPVMAATIVGKGKFARRVPKSIRDLLMAESASNGVTTAVCLGLGILLTRFPGSASEMTRSLFVYTIIYQILVAGVAGLIIGWAAQKALKGSYERKSADRESFLVFYLMFALFCVGLGSLLGIDDVLLAFCAGYMFDKSDLWREKIMESHVSDAINLVLNLTYFVFLGSMIPWSSFNKPELQISAWRLVAGTLLIFLLRRLPVIVLLKPVIPDIKTWREALFYGHFGPVGVGAIFSAALISSEPGKTGIAGNLLRPPPDDPMQLSLWPIVTFVVLCSSIVHGSSIPLFHLGKHINTLTITMSYTAGSGEEPAWMNRLPRIPTLSSSKGKSLDTDEYPPGTLPTIGLQGGFLRRQREDIAQTKSDRSGSPPPLQHKQRNWVSGMGFGSLTGQSAIFPTRPFPAQLRIGKPARGPASAYQFGNTIIVEDEDGEVIKTYEIPSSTSKRKEHMNVFGKVPKAVPKRDSDYDDEDRHVRFTIGGTGRRMTKDDFLREIQLLGTKERTETLDPQEESSMQAEMRAVTYTGNRNEESHSRSGNVILSSGDYPETRVEKNRRLAALGLSEQPRNSEEDDALSRDYPETPAEKRRRLAALGLSKQFDTTDEDCVVSGSWMSKALMTRGEPQLDDTGNCENRDATCSSNSEGTKGRDDPKTQSSRSHFGIPIPQVVITPPEDHKYNTQDTAVLQVGNISEESESETSGSRTVKKDKRKKRVSWES